MCVCGCRAAFYNGDGKEYLVSCCCDDWDIFLITNVFIDTHVLGTQHRDILMGIFLILSVAKNAHKNKIELLKEK